MSVTVHMTRVIFTYVWWLFTVKRERERGNRDLDRARESTRERDKWIKREKRGTGRLAGRRQYWIKAICCFERKTILKGLYLVRGSICMSAYVHMAAH